MESTDDLVGTNKLSSDGFHTFEELYAHRNTLFVALMRAHPRISWIAEKHSDGTSYRGWFLAGMTLPTGDITYHLPDSLWELTKSFVHDVREYAPEWDGHTSDDVLRRLLEWISFNK